MFTTAPSKCVVYCFLQDILGNNIGSAEQAEFSVYGGAFKYNDFAINESKASSLFDANGYSQLVVIETETPGSRLNFSIKYISGKTMKQINFLPVIVPNDGAINIASIATVGA